MTRAHQQVRKRPDERRIRPNLVPLRNREPFAQAKVRHQRTHVIPTPSGQTNHVIAQFVQDLVHLERCRHRLDQHRRPNRPAGKPQRLLRVLKQAVPQPGLMPVFDLGEVEVRPVIALEQRPAVVEHRQPKIHQGRTGWVRAPGRVRPGQVVFCEIPPPRSQHHRRRVRVACFEGFPRTRLEREITTGSPHETFVSRHHVRPGGRHAVF